MTNSRDVTGPDDPTDRIVALEADNARLRRLLDEGGVPDGLRHALRDTVAMLRSIMRQSAGSREDVESYVAHLEGRLAAIMRMRAATDAFGEADLHGLISDELMFHGVREGERAELMGPVIRLRSKPAQVIALAVHELASNAIEHGALGGMQGRVQVAWRIDSGAIEPVLTLMWRETGGTRPAEPIRRGFGTMVLEEMPAYDLKARTVLTYEADGLRCTIDIPFTSQIGRVVEEAEDEAVSSRGGIS